MPGTTLSLPHDPVTSGNRRLTNGVVLTLVIVSAVGLAVLCYSQFLSVSRYRWDGAVHDRNAHYLFGLNLALDVRLGDLKQLFSDLDGARTWTPLHGILVGAVLLAGGTDYRLAVLPSLAGWVLTVVFAFLIGRRIVPRGGNLAGLVAALFAACSPAHKAFATDIMLESLGCGLTLAALYAYLVAGQDASARRGRVLGLSLTALFLLKYNYWLLVVFGLVASEFLAQPRYFTGLVRHVVTRTDWRTWLRAQIRQPLNYGLVITAALLAAVTLGRGTPLAAVGRLIPGTPAHGLLYATYIFLFLRVATWWWGNGRRFLNGLTVRARQVVLWHVMPVGLWFLWPKRLQYLVWYISPANSGERPDPSLWGGVHYYTLRAVEDYHAQLGATLIAVGLTCVAVLALRSLSPRHRVVLLFLGIAALLTVLHPNHKSRHLHSWIPALWIMAGVGLSGLVYGRWTTRLVSYRPALAVMAIAGLLAAHLPALIQRGYSPERGHTHLAASTRDLTEYYLPLVAGSRKTAFLASVEVKHMARWSFQERFGRRVRVETDLKGLTLSPEENRRTFDRWAAATDCDTIVFLDMTPGSYFDEVTTHNAVYMTQIPLLLDGQTAFPLAHQHTFDRYGCTVKVYSRTANQAHAAATTR